MAKSRIAEEQENDKPHESLETPKRSHATQKKAITRTAMGEYIVPPGGKPLTVLANPNVPGPASYLPRIAVTKPSAPQYSLKGRYKQSEGDQRPGPADYQVDHDLLWKRKTLMLKGREQEISFVEPGANDLGPAGYNIEYDTVGKGRPKYSIKGRKPFKLQTGPTTLMFQAIDTAGPADYNLSSVPAWDGPAYSLAKRLPTLPGGVGEKRPGPNEYELGTTVGKCEGASMTSRRETFKPQETPGPNSYTLKDTIDLNAKAASLTYRWYDEDKREEGTPGDGPAKYDIRKSFAENDKPAFTMGKRLKESEKDNTGPGPGQYEVKARPEMKSAPEFSFAKRLPKLLRTSGPGPAQYKPKLLDGAPMYTMTRRPASHKGKVKSSPGPYRLPEGATRWGRQVGGGITFKSRASPFVYSGFKTRKIFEPMSPL
ncbi:uncharacterized protein LOC135475757 [Liolophura sinensis]|uniref:uncharacterized protein LOC135475757 n=1 Tax=Liolophura sinensis TaxID=3198878 RepID=UPI003158763F